MNAETPKLFVVTGPRTDAVRVSQQFRATAEIDEQTRPCHLYMRSRLSAVGAAAGVVVGGALAKTAGVAMLVGVGQTGWWRGLLAWPARWMALIGFVVMIVVSLCAQSRIVPGVSRIVVGLRALESLGLERAEELR